MVAVSAIVAAWIIWPDTVSVVLWIGMQFVAVIVFFLAAMAWADAASDAINTLFKKYPKPAHGMRYGPGRAAAEEWANTKIR